MSRKKEVEFSLKNLFKWLTVLLALTAMATAFALVDGVYRDKAPGYGGDVIVRAVVRDGRLMEITTENTGGEKSEYYRKAEEELIPLILEKQGIDGLDTVAGATGTSESILTAMRGVMEQVRYTGQGEANAGSVKEPSLTPEPKPTV